MARSAPDWPDWWTWELDCENPHLQKRMVDRRFSEAILREMLEDSTSYRLGEPGRWIITTAHGGEAWEVIVEPQPEECSLIVVTAYRVE